ncbi:TPA_asm: protein 4 [Amentotaxus virus 1]|uniref:Protein 4 n=1 Tax=Amentotaxus virus 1 TaxID=2977950 RepID=A0A9N6YIZ8_9RHAB|nr:TPA_asm: protein 4 [Amentotaxus virus 1]
MSHLMYGSMSSTPSETSVRLKSTIGCLAYRVRRDFIKAGCLPFLENEQLCNELHKMLLEVSFHSLGPCDICKRNVHSDNCGNLHTPPRDLLESSTVHFHLVDGKLMTFCGYYVGAKVIHMMYDGMRTAILCIENDYIPKLSVLDKSLLICIPCSIAIIKQKDVWRRLQQIGWRSDTHSVSSSLPGIN